MKKNDEVVKSGTLTDAGETRPRQAIVLKQKSHPQVDLTSNFRKAKSCGRSLLVYCHSLGFVGYNQKMSGFASKGGAADFMWEIEGRNPHVVSGGRSQPGRRRERVGNEISIYSESVPIVIHPVLFGIQAEDP